MARFFRLIGLVFLLVPIGSVALADRESDLDRLMDLLAFDETIAIMHEEGLRYGGQLAQDMLPDADAESWKSTVTRIYDEEKMLILISRDFRNELSDADLTPMLDYFSGADGREVVALELDARRAFLNPGIEAEAVDQFEAMKGENSALIDQVEALISDSDLVEFNVMGTLNASLMFYRGLSEGGVYDVPESEILADVWSQEEETRRSSREWLGAFLTKAYQPLEPEKLEVYASFYRTPAGRELNRAIFAAFDQMYEELSYLMGLAVAEHMSSEPL
ncbi:DUF2059 domain-containing protein [uncultured Roseovarius sp.]|uniref:DUF2059 domain-containing protein n=1 Tax=uncultured Roseovarius sp. TaxID=293344 RepID=UPI002626602D|nr:DUF2059 domain-containing protein [uncultured Roseovarius sp.]